MIKLDQSLNHQLRLSGCSAALWCGGGLQQAPVKFYHCYHHILQVYCSLSLFAMHETGASIVLSLMEFCSGVRQDFSSGSCCEVEFFCHWLVHASVQGGRRVWGHGGRDWEVGGKVWRLVQVCWRGWRHSISAGGSSKETFIRSSLIISPIWLSTWFCDFARCCSSTWRAYWWLCLWWRWRCWDSVATSCRSCLHLARHSPGFLYPMS